MSGTCNLGEGVPRRLKFGTRYARQESLHQHYSFSGKALTSDGRALNAARNNAISVASVGQVEQSPTNFMKGDAGYAGGYLVYAPDRLLGNQVAANFPNSGILRERGYVENLDARRLIKENTLAGYLMGEFAAFDERVAGNVGLRVVRTETRATARTVNSLTTPVSYPEITRGTSYNNALPSLNVTGAITPDLPARSGSSSARRWRPPCLTAAPHPTAVAMASSRSPDRSTRRRAMCAEWS